MNEFSRRAEDVPGDFPSGWSRDYAADGSRKILSFDPLAPTDRELQGFIRNLRTDPRIRDEWLKAYIDDPTDVHLSFTEAVRREIERRGIRASDGLSDGLPRRAPDDVVFPDGGGGGDR